MYQHTINGGHKKTREAAPVYRVDVKRAKLGRKQACGHFCAPAASQPATRWSVFPAALVHREPSLSAVRSARTVSRPAARSQQTGARVRLRSTHLVTAAVTK